MPSFSFEKLAGFCLYSHSMKSDNDVSDMNLLSSIDWVPGGPFQSGNACSLMLENNAQLFH